MDRNLALFVLMSCCQILCGQDVVESTSAAPGTVDLVFVATAPSIFTKQRIGERVVDALKRINGQGDTQQRVKVEPISLFEYRDLKRLAEGGAINLVRTGDESPLVYKAESTGLWIVRAKDPAEGVSEIEVEYKDKNNEIQTEKWKVDLGQANVEGVRFRVYSSSNGEYTFMPDPSWDLIRYRLVSNAGDANEWQMWPKDRSRFLIRIARFPAITSAYDELTHNMESKDDVNPIQISPSRETLFSVGVISRNKPTTENGWHEDAFVISIFAEKMDAVWILFPLTVEQKESIEGKLKSLLKTGVTERTFADKLIQGKELAGFAIAGPKDSDLNGRFGAKWYPLQMRRDNEFFKTFTVSNSELWDKTFRENPMETYFVQVNVKNGQAQNRKGNLLWEVSSEQMGWNGGRKPSKK